MRWASPIALLGIWELLSGTGLVSTQLLPSPAMIVSAVQTVVADGELPGGLVVSLRRMAIAFVLGALIGGGLGVAAGLSRWIDATVDPLLQMLRNIPLFALPALLILWFGIGETPKIILVMLAVALPIYVNVYAGIKQTDAALVEATTVLGYNRWERLWHVVLPAAVPHTLVGIRIGIASGWLALVVAETIASDTGIGFMINNAREFLRTDIVIVGILTYAVVGLLMDTIIRLIERRILRWQSA
ncbi:MAG TPA: ABC transporter permease [Pseudonocardiaceae bacterium]